MAKKMVTEKKAISELSEELKYLFDRWASEKKYENIEDYQIHLQEKFSDMGIKIYKLKPRPFELWWIFKGRKFRTIVSSKDIKVYKIDK